MKEYTEDNVRVWLWSSSISFDEFQAIDETLAKRGLRNVDGIVLSILDAFPTKEEFLAFLESEGL